MLLDTRKYLENDFYFIILITVLDRYLRILGFLYQKLRNSFLDKENGTGFCHHHVQGEGDV
jgi:hypothetical protein